MHIVHTSHLASHTSHQTPHDSSQPGRDFSQPGRDSSQPGRNSIQPGSNSSQPGRTGGRGRWTGGRGQWTGIENPSELRIPLNVHNNQLLHELAPPVAQPSGFARTPVHNKWRWRDRTHYSLSIRWRLGDGRGQRSSTV